MNAMLPCNNFNFFEIALSNNWFQQNVHFSISLQRDRYDDFNFWKSEPCRTVSSKDRMNGQSWRHWREDLLCTTIVEISWIEASAAEIDSLGILRESRRPPQNKRSQFMYRGTLDEALAYLTLSITTRLAISRLSFYYLFKGGISFEN